MIKHSLMIDFLLSFCQPTLLIVFILLLFMIAGRKVAIQTILLMALCLILNVALKVTFQVPLMPHFGKMGFALPSGHAQYTTVFYLWMAYQFRSRWISLLAIPIIASVGYGLVAAGYHSLHDVIWGEVTGVLLVLSYIGLVNYDARRIPLVVLLLSSVLMIYIPLRFLPVPLHALIAYGIIWGTVGAMRIERLWADNKKANY